MSTKIYSWHGNPRGDAVRVAAEFAGVEYEFINTPFSEIKAPEYLARNPLGKVPLLETPEGSLVETAAIIKYFARKCNRLGTTPFEEAQVEQWLSWFNSDFIAYWYPIFGQNLGFIEFNEETYKPAKQALSAKLRILEQHLQHNTYLAGEALSAAEMIFIPFLASLFWTVLDESFRKGHVALTRWFKHCLSFAPFKKFFRQPFLAKKEWISVKADKKEAAPKKEKQQQQPKKTEKKAEKKAEEVVVPKKAKNPLEELPASKFVLFDFKTFIVNEKDTKKAVASFWEQFDAEGYSIWHTKYDKYEGEGEKLFLTQNMMSSFLQRLDNFRKWCFGNYGVYGNEGCYEIMGIWVWRGTEIPQEIKDLPNYEYNFWTRLDHTKPEDRARLEEHWCNRVNDESVVEGLTARDVCWFK